MIALKKQNYIQIEFSDGTIFSTSENTDSLWEFIRNNSGNEQIIKKKVLNGEGYSREDLLNKINNSNILVLRGNSVYMPDVSEITIPEDFVIKIVEAEEANNEAEIMKYKNFWTLVSMNPDSRVRNNIFWFIRKWDMQITDAGLIIGYRNADLKEEAHYSANEAKYIINKYYQEKYINNNNVEGIILPEYDTTLAEMYNEIVNGASSPVFTDHHSHSTEIILGKPVSIPRSQCDENQEHSCSQGLHVGAKGWLKRNYYGRVGLMVLVDPSKIVAVPSIDNYGKMRTCEYLPVAIIDFDENGDIIENNWNLYNDVNYLNELKYSGSVNNEDHDMYELKGLYKSREDVYNSILQRLKNDK